jgi:hypothetical protein
VILIHTYVSVYNARQFADAYKVCNACGGWITGMLDNPGRPLVMPCEHDLSYADVCPSWGPVDGCSCAEFLGHVPHREPPKLDPLDTALDSEQP